MWNNVQLERVVHDAHHLQRLVGRRASRAGLDVEVLVIADRIPWQLCKECHHSDASHSGRPHF